MDVVSGRLYPGGNDFVVPEDHKYWVTPDGFDLDHTPIADILESGYIANGYNGALAQSGFNYVLHGYNNQDVRAAHSNFISKGLSRIKARTNPKSIIYRSKAYDSNAQTVAAAIQLPVYGVNNPGGLGGCYIRRYSLPNKAVPEANSEFYNRCVVVELPDSCPWGVGRLFLHYNV